MGSCPGTLGHRCVFCRRCRKGIRHAREFGFSALRQRRCFPKRRVAGSGRPGSVRRIPPEAWTGRAIGLPAPCRLPWSTASACAYPERVSYSRPSDSLKRRSHFAPLAVCQYTDQLSRPMHCQRPFRVGQVGRSRPGVGRPESSSLRFGDNAVGGSGREFYKKGTTRQI